MQNTLCLYYTRTGSTKRLMETMAGKLGGELVEYTDGKSRKGMWGYLTACVDSFKRKLPKIRPFQTKLPLREYDAVVIAMPIWAEGCCCVGKGLLAQYKDQLPQRVFFLITHMADSDYEKQIQSLDQYLNQPHIAHLSVSTKKEDLTKELAAFAEQIRREIEIS